MSGSPVLAQPRPPFDGQVVVTAVQGEQLVPADRGNVSDPYLQFELLSGSPTERVRQRGKTKVAKETLSPRWDESVNFKLAADDAEKYCVLTVSVMDYDTIGRDDYIGGFVVDIQQLMGKSGGAWDTKIEEIVCDVDDYSGKVKKKHLAAAKALNHDGLGRVTLRVAFSKTMETILAEQEAHAAAETMAAEAKALAERRHQAAARIQARARGGAALKSFRQTRWLVFRIQSMSRGFLQRTIRKKEKSAITKLQAAFRGFRARNGAGVAELVMEQKARREAKAQDHEQNLLAAKNAAELEARANEGPLKALRRVQGAFGQTHLQNSSPPEITPLFLGQSPRRKRMLRPATNAVTMSSSAVLKCPVHLGVDGFRELHTMKSSRQLSRAKKAALMMAIRESGNSPASDGIQSEVDDPSNEQERLLKIADVFSSTRAIQNHKLHDHNSFGTFTTCSPRVPLGPRPTQSARQWTPGTWAKGPPLQWPPPEERSWTGFASSARSRADHHHVSTLSMRWSKLNQRQVAREAAWEKALTERRQRRAGSFATPVQSRPEPPSPQTRKKVTLAPIERQLRRARKEDAALQSVLADKRLALNKEGQNLLKDLKFLFEKMVERQNSRNVGFNPNKAQGNRIRELIDDLKAQPINTQQLMLLRTNHKEALRELFDEIDVDKSGLLDASEVKHLTRSIGRSLDDVALAKAMKDIDHDGSGEVDFGEFYAWWVSDKRGEVMSTTVEGSSENFKIVPHKTKDNTARAKSPSTKAREAWQNGLDLRMMEAAAEQQKSFAAGAAGVDRAAVFDDTKLGQGWMRSLQLTEETDGLKYAGVHAMHELHQSQMQRREQAQGNIETDFMNAATMVKLGNVVKPKRRTRVQP